MRFILVQVRWLVTAAALLIFDAVTRHVCFAVCNSSSSWFGLSPFANFQFAFSLPLPIWLMYGVYGCVLSAVVHMVWSKWNSAGWQQRLAFLFILCGGGLNIFERILTGYVRDFIQVAYGYYNVGDVYILAGVTILLCSSRELAKKG
ncbi:MAG: signal peptidase II [Candidatus Doudnabacteria bacterium]|nr:signal peptidase II [Candidatus Doudnabacteria bacterium]